MLDHIGIDRSVKYIQTARAALHEMLENGECINLHPDKKKYSVTR